MRRSEGELRTMMIDGLDGNAKAHAALLTAIVPMLRGFYARRLIGFESDIEDLVQDTLIAVHTKRATYHRQRSFTTWLFAIARYKMIDHVRREKLRVVDEFDDAAEEASMSDALEARIDIEALLQELPIKQANAIRMTKLDGLTSEESAERTGRGLSDIKVSVHRGLRSLTAMVIGR